jgi:hypothetical protein
MNKDNKTMEDLSDEELMEMAGGYNISVGDLTVPALPDGAIAVMLYGVLPTNPGIFQPEYGIKPFPKVMYGVMPLYGVKAPIDLD